ncbi:hypothetical protein GGR16_002652 [Chelatococcus caeni]|uniref:DUF2800 domain-containing protein n=1 Tax=Chelatococcus caeni TaxID=1348468 RepID=A0A840C1T2_9HYPH|nr:DUF2800 domain-containing protein [Chelatococcus caeni]MBB4017618.1 hypothetical protein [Chelatococcus caeni]
MTKAKDKHAEGRAHADRAHAKLAPSAASRWVNCPGSVRLSAGIESRSSIWADEGTAAHTLAEMCLNTGFDADRFLDGCVDVNTGRVHETMPPQLEGKPRVFAIDEEMAGAVQVYLDLVRSLVQEGDEYETEQRLDLSSVHPDIFGTGDFLLYRPSTHKLVIVDYKHGKGVAVDPRENKQLMTYAVGAALRYHNRGIDEVELIVVQPRAEGDEVKTWKTDAVTLLEWRFELEAAAKATEEPDAPLQAGEWCKFCPALPDCPANRARRAELARIEFAEDGELKLSEPSTIAPERLAAILREAHLFKDWFRRVEEFAHAEATEGRMPPGFKLVAKRATRRWRDEDEAASYLSMVYGLDDEALYERKMLSPAKAETVIGKKNKDDIKHLVVSKSSGTNLVPEEDKRPAVRVDAKTEFAEA